MRQEQKEGSPGERRCVTHTPWRTSDGCWCQTVSIEQYDREDEC